MSTIIFKALKYVLIFLMMIYVYMSFSANIGNKRRNYKLITQNVLTLVMFAIGIATIIYNNSSTDMIILCAFEFVFLLVYVITYRLYFQNSMTVVVNNVAQLLSIGFIMIVRLNSSMAFKQFMIVMVGALLAILAKVICKDWQRLAKFKVIYIILGLLLLSVTLILGKTTWGANISIDIYGFTFQPSEFVKLLFVLGCAAMLYDAKDFWKILTTSILAAAHVIILILSNDLGGALIFFVVYIVMLYVATGQFRYMIAGSLCAVAASILAYKYVTHVRTRINAWLDPFSIIETGGYQITQSLFAIGTGGLFGLGLYAGTPHKIPVVAKDFIYAAISEELGTIFGICMILICFSCFVYIMRSASKEKELFNKLVLVGFGVTYIFQCFLSVGGSVKFIPSTGVTIPFVSYGGSSMLCSMLMFGMIYAIENNRKEMEIIAKKEKQE